MMAFTCSKCGKEIRSDAKFCTYCGAEQSVAEDNESLYTKAYDLANENNADCIGILETLVERNYPDACFALGNFCEYDNFNMGNIEKAIFYYEKAIELGNTTAKSSLANLYYCAKAGDDNRSKAFNLLSDLSISGEAGWLDYFNLARCYICGVGTDTDNKKALEQCKKAIDLEPKNRRVLSYYADLLDKNEDDSCIKVYEDLISDDVLDWVSFDSAYQLYLIYLESNYIKKDLYKALDLIDWIVRNEIKVLSSDISSEEKDLIIETCSIAENHRKFLLFHSDCVKNSEFDLMPSVKEKYHDIYSKMDEAEMPRIFFIALETDVRNEHELSYNYIFNSFEKGLPYFIVNEDESIFAFDQNNLFSGNPLAKESMHRSYLYNSTQMSIYNPVKACYWAVDLYDSAKKGDRLAQSIFIQNKKRYLNAVESGDDASKFVTLPYIYFSDETIEEDFSKAVNNKEPAAMMALVANLKGFNDFTDEYIIEMLNYAGNNGIGDAWYFLGDFYRKDYIKANHYSSEGFENSNYFSEAIDAYKKCIEQNGKYFVDKAKQELDWYNVEYDANLPNEQSNQNNENNVQNVFVESSQRNDNDEILDLENAGRNAFCDGNYTAAERAFNKILDLDINHWEAKFFLSIIDILRSDYDDSIGSINMLRKVSANLVENIMTDFGNDMELKSGYCELLPLCVEQAAGHLFSLQTDMFNNVKVMPSQDYIHPSVGFFNLTLCPRCEDIAEILFKLGDELVEVNENETAKTLYNSGIIIYGTSAECGHGTFSEKRERKAIYRQYKEKLKSC